MLAKLCRNFSRTFRSLHAHFTQHPGIGTSSGGRSVRPDAPFLAHAAARSNGRVTPRPRKGPALAGVAEADALPRARGGAGCGKLYRARSRLYRNEILQENMRWKALAEIYTMHSFAPFWNRSLSSMFCLKITEILPKCCQILLKIIKILVDVG